jgi:Zn-dependent metalloprotease
MNKPLLPAALLTLSLVGCGDLGRSSVTSTRELGVGPERTAAIQGALVQALSRSVELGIQSPEDLVARSVLVDDDGTEHVRMDRTYRGLRVIGGDLVVHRRTDGTAQEMSLASSASLKDLAFKPTLDVEGAVLRAESAFSGERQGPGRAEPVVDARPGRAPALAYEVVLEGFRLDTTPSELHVLVDASTGAIREKWDAVHTSAAAGTGYSLYSGTVQLSTNSVSGGYELRDVTRGAGFYTMDMKSRQLPPLLGNGIFTDADNAWGTGIGSSTQSAAVDAHFGQQVTYDYYKNAHGRNGIDGAGKTGYNRVHYGKSYNNAYWQDSCFCMTYGDGDGSVLSALTSLDVAGHEMSHGVTSRTANLTYSDESGGLNEATSDIFGSMVEFSANSPSDPGDYLIGETIYTPGTPGDALRYMYRPSLDGSSPDCWYNGIGSLDVHYSSGIANHFFYLLAEGSAPAGGPSSPTCNAASLSGLGREKAAKVWYRALTVYMTSSTNYAGARAATLSAAVDLFGAGSAESSAVAAAWAAVNVN